MKRQNSRPLYRDECGPIKPRDTLIARVRKPSGLPPIYEEWTPNVRGLDPRYMRIGPPMHGDWTPDAPGHKIQHPPDKDFVGSRTSRKAGLCGIQDFVGFRTSWDSGLRGIQDFMGTRSSWDLGLSRKTGPSNTSDRNFVLWCSLREHKLSG